MYTSGTQGTVTLRAGQHSPVRKTGGLEPATKTEKRNETNF
jgi:hypothetical protein